MFTDSAVFVSSSVSFVEYQNKCNVEPVVKEISQMRFFKFFIRLVIVTAATGLFWPGEVRGQGQAQVPSYIGVDQNSATTSTTARTWTLTPTYANDTHTVLFQSQQQVNTCSVNTCLNGNCTSTANGYKCNCNPKYTGKNCEYLNHCFNHKCENGATCIESHRSAQYTCKCAAGFSGKFCEISTICDEHYCQNNGTCRTPSYNNDVSCVCAPGYTGQRCETKINYCESSPCENNGVCLSNELSYSCDCHDTGFKGFNCSENINECVQYPCYNNGTCIDLNGSYKCMCTKEFSGQNCQYHSLNCSLVKCKNGGQCVDTSQGSMCQCLDDYTGPFCEFERKHCQTDSCYQSLACLNGYCLNKNPCLRNPCLNDGTCLPSGYPSAFSCVCQPGYTGQFCEINGCRMKGIPCEHGYCFFFNHSYSCLCERGFSGERCERNFDECLSSPCKNNATCRDGIDQFICDCPLGYAGIDCAIDINECDPNPCLGNSQCIDKVNDFQCNCENGLSGRICEIDIDDCLPNLCKNNGTCIDALNSYTCNCSDTGFQGANCEYNINDCASDPCRNGGTCVDQIKDFACKCYAGYSGRQCEIDIDECAPVPCKFGSTCLQRSNLSLYQWYNEEIMLPDIFLNEFSYLNASGYECVCVNGTAGENCEIDIDECETVHCVGGKCEDKLGYYICNCDEGYEGPNCEIEIDECDKYKPCLNGAKCFDKIANYYCDCMPGFGGKNCSIKLVGCLENRCLNNGTCKPDLINETIHSFNCSCPLGFYGHTCEKITTMSFSGQSFVKVNTTKEEGYEIQFRFRTTIDNALLACGQGQTYYTLKLSGGRLNLHSSLLNKWEGVFVGSFLNNSQWQRIFVAINATHLVLAANDEQTISPITLNENMNTSHTRFTTTYLGGTISELRAVANSPSFFVGCLENTIVNGQWVLPPQQNHSQTNESNSQIFNNVEIGCPRSAQCDPNPCQSSSTCIDNWRTFSCLCQRPYLGNTCQYNYTPATFGYENISDSYVTVEVSDLAKKITQTFLHISMFIRTRKSAGKIFYIGSALSANKSDSIEPESYIATMLKDGKLVLKIRFKSTPTSISIKSQELDNGYYHFIEVIRVTQPQVQIKVKLNGTEYFKNSADDNFNVEVLYLGDWPDFESVNRKFEDKISESSELLTDYSSYESFKGILQDVQISNGSQNMVVEFFPLELDEMPPKFGNVSFDPKKVLKGVLSDNVCKINLCQNNGTCIVTWNDYICACNVGFKGRNCEQIEYCQKNECPDNYTCHSINNYYECLANLTFDGHDDQPLTYNFVSNTNKSYTFHSMELAARTRNGGYLLTIEHKSYSLSLKVNESRQVLIESIFENSNDTVVLTHEIEHENWFQIFIDADENDRDILNIRYVFNESSKTAQVSLNNVNFTKVLIEGNIVIGGRTVPESESLYSTTTSTLIVDKRNLFKGCLGVIKFDNLSLWYSNLVDVSKFDYYFKAQNEINQKNIGCKLCHDKLCNDGHCVDEYESYMCNCSIGYSGSDCSILIDSCINHECKNGGICVDGNQCKCTTNYSGEFCEIFNNCSLSSCKEGEICKQINSSYVCECATGANGTDCLSFPANSNSSCSQVSCMNCSASDSDCVSTCHSQCDTNNCDNLETCTCSNNEIVCKQPTTNESTESFKYVIVGLLLVFLVLVGVVSLGVFITVARTKRATRGTYSPSEQEYSSPRVELDSVLKQPPEERLI